MTRINLVEPAELINKHLIAEYSELPRVFGLVQRGIESGRIFTIDIPKKYTMGKGHVVFFYDKLQFLEDRWEKIRKEMRRRKKQVNLPPLREMYPNIPPRWYGNYIPTEKAMKISRGRLMFKLLKMGVLR